MKRMGVVTSIVFVAAATVGGGCTGDGGLPTPDSVDPLITQLISLGFRGDMIEDRGDYFQVEGDIAISKAFIPEMTGQLAHPPGGPSPDFQWTRNTVVNPDRVRFVRADLRGLASMPTWQTAARQALQEWTNISCSRVVITEANPGDITFSIFSDSDIRLAAHAAFPSGTPGAPGTYVQVNRNYTGSPNNSSTELRNMVHEIGHTLGFRHTNWQGLGESSDNANLVPGTPQTDATSVMNGATATTSWAGFSANDLLAARTVYPDCPNPHLSGPGQVQPYVTCTWTANATDGTPPYLYSWMGGPFTSGRTFLYRSIGSDFTMRVAVKDATGLRNDVTQSVHVYQYGPACG